MSQIIATFVRVIKELLRDKVLVFWSVFFAIIWLIMANVVFLANARRARLHLSEARSRFQ